MGEGHPEPDCDRGHAVDVRSIVKLMLLVTLANHLEGDLK